MRKHQGFKFCKTKTWANTFFKISRTVIEAKLKIQDKMALFYSLDLPEPHKMTIKTVSSCVACLAKKIFVKYPPVFYNIRNRNGYLFMCIVLHIHLPEVSPGALAKKGRPRQNCMQHTDDTCNLQYISAKMP